MRILALETSGKSGSVAALRGDVLLAEEPLEPSQRSAQSLAPAMRQLLEAVDWTPRDVQLVAVTLGPGSFTGLRVGVTTAKTFAYAVGAEVVAVNTLEVIARQAPDDPAGRKLSAVLDAGRGELFIGAFTGSGSQRAWMGPPAIQSVETWLAGLDAGWRVTGPALARLAGRLPVEIEQVGAEFWYPAAATVGRLAAAKYAAGQRDDLWTLAPLYLRKSAAEEKEEGGRRKEEG